VTKVCFSAAVQLVGWQEGHLICKKNPLQLTPDVFPWGPDLTYPEVNPED